MASIQLYKLFVIYFFSYFSYAWAGYTCKKRYGSYPPYTYTNTYCEHSCCGSSDNQYCCQNDHLFVYYNNIPLIAGCIFGAMAFIGFCVALVCCCLKKQTHAGRVVRPSPGLGTPSGSAIVQTQNGVYYQMYQTTYPTPHPPHADPVKPPPYKLPDRPLLPPLRTQHGHSSLSSKADQPPAYESQYTPLPRGFNVRAAYPPDGIAPPPYEPGNINSYGPSGTAYPA